jgi:hypothetical protein
MKPRQLDVLWTRPTVFKVEVIYQPRLKFLPSFFLCFRLEHRPVEVDRWKGQGQLLKLARRRHRWQGRDIKVVKQYGLLRRGIAWIPSPRRRHGSKRWIRRFPTTSSEQLAGGGIYISQEMLELTAGAQTPAQS